MKNLLIVLAVIIVGAGGWYYWNQKQQATPEIEAQPVVSEVVKEPLVDEFEATPPTVTDDSEVAAEPPPEPLIEEDPLPPLAESDSLAIEALGSMLGESVAMRYFEGEDLISRSVASVDALSSRQVPGAIQTIKGPGGEFEVTADDNPVTPILNEEGDPVPQFVVDPVNYRRYLVYVEMLEALDAREVAQMFQQNSPLFEEAFTQLGYPEGDFTDRLRVVIDELLATPELQEPPRLLKPEAVYLYADERLEALSAGQKVLLRMGPENAMRVKAKLREIRAVLTH